MISPDLPMMAVIWEYFPPLKALTRQLEGVRSSVIVYRLYRYDWLFCDAHHSSMHLLYSVNGCC